ncbi:Endogenous retrovirus group FC1 Env polyprotein [Plecturocebus cupreus]
MTSENPNPWAPPAFASPAAPACQFLMLQILLLTILLMSPLKASPYYAWRFYLQESWGEGLTTKTQYIAQVDFRPADCKSIKFEFPKSIATTLKRSQNNFGLCFLHDQTKIVCHKWSGIFGGCPYASCVMHKAPKSEMLVIDNQGKISLTIRDPWHARWEKGTAVPLRTGFNLSQSPMGPDTTLTGIPLFKAHSQNLSLCYRTTDNSSCNMTVKLKVYGQAEFQSLLTPPPPPVPRNKRAIFLPVVVGLSLASSLVAAGIGNGAMGYSVTSAAQLEDKLCVAIEASAASLASLQRQIMSLAQVPTNSYARNWMSSHQPNAPSSLHLALSRGTSQLTCPPLPLFSRK